MYTKKDFGRDLLIELSHGYDPIRIARWADILLHRIQEDLDDEVDTHIKDLSCMSFGEEFYISEDDLHSVSISLLRPKQS